MELIFNISDIAIITGDNTFKTKNDYLIDFWKKNYKTDFEKYKKLTQFIKETDNDIILNISSKNNVDISLELQKCKSSTNINDLQTIKKTILDKVSNLSEVDKKEITKSITNVTNTKFGIKNEDDITKLYESLSGNSIIKDNKYHKIKIFETNVAKIFIGGKIDGIDYNKSLIIEVKNRIHKLFYTLKNYEKVQIMCYMYLFSCKKGHLVEAYKTKEKPLINIIEVDFDEIYMNDILQKILCFANFFCDFINDHDAKIKLLKIISV